MKCLENKAISDGQGVEPTIVKENVSTALVDGNNILGRSTNQIELPIKSKSESMVFTRSITVMIFFSITLRCRSSHWEVCNGFGDEESKGFWDRIS